MKENCYTIDTIYRYNQWYSKETLHPLVTVLNHDNIPQWLNGATLRYGVYGLFLKQGDGCSIRYGRESYDYQEGTVVSFAPGQTVTVEWNAAQPMPPSRGLLFQGAMSVGEISYRLGFQYAQHFTRLFKAKMGITPNEYRRL